jgi:hypothetical protein
MTKREKSTGFVVRAIVGILLFSLVVTLATRNVRLDDPSGVTVQASAAVGMRQHLDRDAPQWLPPVLVFTTLQAPTFYPQVAPGRATLGVLLLEDSLANRPPPSC